MAGRTSCAVDCSKLALALLVVFCGAARGGSVSRETWDTARGLPQNTVQAIAQTRDGYLWFATEGGLARFNTERFTVFNTRNTPQIRSNDIRALLEDDAGGLWIGTADGMAKLADGHFQAFSVKDGLPTNGVTALFEDSGHRPCAVTVGGNVCFDGRRFVVSKEVPVAAAIDAELQRQVDSLVLCSFKDREGSVWIGTESSGVTILRQLRFEAYSGRAEGLDDQVRCVLRSRSGAVWFGTDSHGLTRFAGGKFRRFTVADGLSSNVIVSLGEEAGGDILAGTPDGLNRLHGNTVTLATSSEGLPDDFIRSIYTDTDGTAWIGTRRGLARLYGGNFHTFTHADGLGSDLIGSITRDKAGVLWVATLNGLSRLNGNRFQNYAEADGLPANVVTALYGDTGGVLWIGTQGGGLLRYARGRFERVTMMDMPQTIYGIGRDVQRNLWLASDTGISRVQEGPETPQVVNYGVSDGLRVNECSGGGHPGITASGDGGLWFATLRGAALLRADVPLNRVAPPVAVETVSVDNRIVEARPNMVVPPGTSRIAFNYAALSAAAPQRVQFRYELKGFDKAWIDAGNSRTAFYTNLGPGDYSFKVIARNADGFWNPAGAVMPFRLEPRFYQTWWFGAVMVAITAAAGYGIYRGRVARVEAQLESRFEAVLSERNRIAREIHDTLAQGFAGVSVQLEIVSRKLASSGEAAREHLDQARMLVRSSLAEARRSIWELRSQSSEIEDLPARLSKMAAQMSAPGQPKIGVQVRGTFRPLPARTEDELLRIAQEAVTNAIRHAEAKQIGIELAFEGQQLRMTIADDGRGFSPNGQTGGVSGHFGLKGMYERAKEIDAKLNLDTAPGAGTKLAVEVAV